MTDIVVAGETLVDFIPDEPGPLSAVEQFTRRAGGAPANVAVGLSRLDRTPTFWTRVGEDAFGDFLVETLAENDLPLANVERDPDAPTSLAFVSHDETADRQFSFYRDGTADTRMEPGGVDDDALSAADWVHVGGVTLTDDPSRTATFDLMERARENDCTVSFDPNARPELWTGEHDFADSVRRAFELADVVKATPEDLAAAGVTADDPESLVRAVSDHGPHTVFVTLGADGSVAVGTDDAPWPGEVRHAGYEVDPVDTTGAGDAFTAGVIAALAADESLAEAVAFANAVAAAATTGTGAMAALPDRNAVEAFLARHDE